MLEKKYYDGMQIHDVLCECLDDYDTILTILEKFASLPNAINADRKDEPTTQTETQNSNLTFEKDECAKEYEELGLKELKELINADRKALEQTDCSWK